MDEKSNYNYPPPQSPQSPNPPTYEQAVNQSYQPIPPFAPPMTYFYPPSSIPDGTIQYRNTSPPLEPSAAKFETDNKGVISYDEILDYNSNELWKYFMSHGEPPKLSVGITGTHQEIQTRVEFVQTGNGEREERLINETVTITDFDINFDASNYVIPEWICVFAAPESKSNVPQTFMNVLDKYTSDERKLKEIEMAKKVEWDYEMLRVALINLVRYCGYHQNVSVHFNLQHDKVIARSSSIFSKFSHNSCVRCLCFVTCLCIVFYPIYLAMNKSVKDQIVMQFGTRANGAEFYARNINTVITAVAGRQSICVAAQ